MDKIKEAQELADMLLDGVEIKQVGDDKGALPDEPDELEDSMDDLEDYVSMESDDLIESEIFDESGVTPHEKNKLGVSNRFGGSGKVTYAGKVYGGKSKELGIKSLKNKERARQLDAMSKFQEKQARKNAIKIESEESNISKMVGNIATYLGEGRVVKDSDKLKSSITKEPTTESSFGFFKPEDKAKANKTLKDLYNPKKKAKVNKTLKDLYNPKKKEKEYIAKEGMLDRLQSWGKEKMMQKRKKGLKVTEKRDKDLKDTMEG